MLLVNHAFLTDLEFLSVWWTQKSKTKRKLYLRCVLSNLLYGSECWNMTASDLNKLLIFYSTERLLT